MLHQNQTKSIAITSQQKIQIDCFGPQNTPGRKHARLGDAFTYAAAVAIHDKVRGTFVHFYEYQNK